jgi:hypothetical protein
MMELGMSVFPKEWYLKEMMELGMSAFPKEWYQSSNVNVWVILDKYIHNRLMVVAIKEDSSSRWNLGRFFMPLSWT